MSSAGQKLIAGRIPGERIATTIRMSAVGTFTAETELDSVTAPLVAGRTYRVRAVIPMQSTAASDMVRFRIREDNVSGNTLLLDNKLSVAANSNFYCTIETEYTASSTAAKTFLSTAVRQSGSGNLTSNATSSQPAYLYVDYIRG